jgi:hypothetical protein
MFGNDKSEEYLKGTLKYFKNKLDDTINAMLDSHFDLYSVAPIESPP